MRQILTVTVVAGEGSHLSAAGTDEGPGEPVLRRYAAGFGIGEAGQKVCRTGKTDHKIIRELIIGVIGGAR